MITWSKWIKVREKEIIKVSICRFWRLNINTKKENRFKYWKINS